MNALLVNRREAEYFYDRGLDTVSRVEMAREIRFCAHAIFEVFVELHEMSRT